MSQAGLLWPFRCRSGSGDNERSPVGSTPMSMSQPTALRTVYPPSAPCTCDVCLAYCNRPGWWTVEEATRAVDAGYGTRMMLEMSPDRSYGVLSPAFRGNEVAFALQVYAGQGCTFLRENRCELFGTGLQPLECRFCHHDRPGEGHRCHAAIGEDWRTPAGVTLVVRWSRITEFWEKFVIPRARARNV